MELPQRYNVIGVGVHALRLAPACDLVFAAARARRRSYVCFCDVNSISCARRDPAHRAALNHSYLTTPDGMPIVWFGKLRGHSHVGRVYGPDLMLAVCSASAQSGETHFLYGGGDGTAEALAAQLRARFPGINILGTHTPPFRELEAGEVAELKSKVGTLKPDFFWVGLSTPKQEKFMSTHGAELDVGLMLGVGAAFDFISGRVRQAPRWIQRSGFEWFFRLCVEPRRLAPRYFKNNPLFLLRSAAQLLRLRRYDCAD